VERWIGLRVERRIKCNLFEVKGVGEKEVAEGVK
jgi:hypothetical protein